MISLIRSTLAILALTALSACTPEPKAGGDTAKVTDSNPPVLAGRQWQLVDFSGQDLTVLARTQPVTLRFDDKAISGQAPCNRINAQYTRDGSTLKFGPVISTKKACLDVINLEAQYFEALATVNRAEIVDGFLRLYGRDVVLTYTEIVDR